MSLPSKGSLIDQEQYGGRYIEGIVESQVRNAQKKQSGSGWIFHMSTVHAGKSELSSTSFSGKLTSSWGIAQDDIVALGGRSMPKRPPNGHYKARASIEVPKA